MSRIDRREFLKIAGAAGVGIVAGGLAVKGFWPSEATPGQKEISLVSKTPTVIPTEIPITPTPTETQTPALVLEKYRFGTTNAPSLLAAINGFNVAEYKDPRAFSIEEFLDYEQYGRGELFIENDKGEKEKFNFDGAELQGNFPLDFWDNFKKPKAVSLGFHAFSIGRGRGLPNREVFSGIHGMEMILIPLEDLPEHDVLYVLESFKVPTVTGGSKELWKSTSSTGSEFGKFRVKVKSLKLEEAGFADGDYLVLGMRTISRDVVLKGNNRDGDKKTFFRLLLANAQGKIVGGRDIATLQYPHTNKVEIIR